MDLKTILSKLLGGAVVVDKKDSNSYTKKLDYYLLSKLTFEDNKSQNQIYKKNIPSIINLGGPMTIYIKDSDTDAIYKVFCSKTTEVSKITKYFFPGQLYFGPQRLLQHNIGNYDIRDGNCLKLVNYHLYGAGLMKQEYYIDENSFEPSYDYDFTNIYDGNKKFYRGGLEYKRPCGWKRIALKVNGKYENDSWLGNSGQSKGDSEWAVSYHGTKRNFVDSIYKNGYRPGPRHLYGDGIYCTPNIETAAKYSERFIGDDGKLYQIVLQNRVKPSAIKKVGQIDGHKDYWLIEDEKNIRLYSICVRSC